MLVQRRRAFWKPSGLKQHLDGASKNLKGLSTTRITAAALRVADHEGLEAISIRLIADELRARPMSLYRHVSGKEQILDLLLDAAYGEIEVPNRASGAWRTDLQEMAIQTRRVLKRHWWLAPLLTSRPPFGPNYLSWLEFLLAAGSAKPAMQMRLKVRIIGTLFAYVNGFIADELGVEATNRKYGLTPQSKRQSAASVLAPLLATQRFPNLAQFVADATEDASDGDFEFGLNCVLDGIRARMEAKKGAARNR